MSKAIQSLSSIIDLYSIFGIFHFNFISKILSSDPQTHKPVFTQLTKTSNLEILKNGNLQVPKSSNSQVFKPVWSSITGILKSSKPQIPNSATPTSVLGIKSLNCISILLLEQYAYLSGLRTCSSVTCFSHPNIGSLPTHQRDVALQRELTLHVGPLSLVFCVSMYFGVFHSIITRSSYRVIFHVKFRFV